MSLSFIIDGKNVEGTSKTFSLSDPGGCESASIQAYGQVSRPNAPVIVCDGNQPLWVGRVEEPGQRKTADRMFSANIGCVGAVTKFAEEFFTALYIDKALSTWASMSNIRLQVIYGAGFSATGPETLYDPTYGPTLKLSRNDAGGATSASEASYDAGPNNLISTLYGSFFVSNLEAAVTHNYFYADDDIAQFPPVSLGAVNLTSFSTSNARPARLLKLQHYNNSSVALNPEIERVILYYNLVVVGDHGMPLNGTAPDKLSINLSKIVANIIARSKIGGTTTIDACKVQVDSLVYPGHVSTRSAMDDAVKLSGYHFGVWPGPATDPLSFRTLFTAPAPSWTATVDYNDCRDPDVTERLSGMNRQAVVSYSLSGTTTSSSLVVTRKHPRLRDGEGGTLSVDAGQVGSVAVAQTYGLLALAADQFDSRGSGSLTLPPMVMTRGGSAIPSHFLRPGVDKLQIRNMANRPLLVGETADRGDTFRLSRLTATEEGGALSTTVEIDQGADLTEVLQARFASADPTGLLAG